MFVISSERSDERSLLLAVVGMTGPLLTPQSENWQQSPPLFIEEVAQAKRSDGGVLKVEQPGGPLAVEEFIKGDNSFGSIMDAIQTINV